MQAMQAVRAGIRRAAQLRAPASDAAKAGQRRGMSSAPGVDDEAEMLKWKHVTRAGVVGCILFGMFAIEHPTPGPEQPAYDYLRIRVKQFPWGKGEKGLFEYWMTPEE